MDKPKMVIGSSVALDFPELQLRGVPARVDTGARTATIWASNIHEQGATLHFTMFDIDHEHHSGQVIAMSDYSRRVVTSSNGHSEERYLVKLLVVIAGRQVRATFTLANRSTQAYPVLVGRNVLRGKFLVDVAHGRPLVTAKQHRNRQLKLPKAEE